LKQQRRCQQKWLYGRPRRQYAHSHVALCMMLSLPTPHAGCGFGGWPSARQPLRLRPRTWPACERQLPVPFKVAAATCQWLSILTEARPCRFASILLPRLRCWESPGRWVHRIPRVMTHTSMLPCFHASMLLPPSFHAIDLFLVLRCTCSFKKTTQRLLSSLVRMCVCTGATCAQGCSRRNRLRIVRVGYSLGDWYVRCAASVLAMIKIHQQCVAGRWSSVAGVVRRRIPQGWQSSVLSGWQSGVNGRRCCIHCCSRVL